MLAVGLLVAGLLASAEAMDDSWTPTFSWDDDADLNPKPVDINPPKEVKLGQEVEHNPQVENMVAKAEERVAPDINCKFAHNANQAACEAYGEHSPVCTGAQMQYVMKCGSWVPQKLYHKNQPEQMETSSLLPEEPVASAEAMSEELHMETLLETSEEARIRSDELVTKEKANEAAMKNAPESAEKLAMTNTLKNQTSPPPGEPTLEQRIEPVLLGCHVKHSEAVLNCKKTIAKKYLEFRAAEKVEQMPEGEAEEAAAPAAQELGSTNEINRVYTEAMGALASVKARKRMGISAALVKKAVQNNPMDLATETELPSLEENSFDSASVSEAYAHDETFDEADPLARSRDIESAALGNVPFLKDRTAEA